MKPRRINGKTEYHGAWRTTGGWIPWFAWRPVRLYPGDGLEAKGWAWLSWVHYRMWEMGSCSETYDFTYQYTKEFIEQ